MSADEEAHAIASHNVADAEGVSTAIAELRGEMLAANEATRGAIKLGIADTRLDVQRAKGSLELGMAGLEAQSEEIIRRLDYTNSKVADHEGAIAAIVKRQGERDLEERIRRERWAERWRPFRFAWMAGRFMARDGFVLKAGTAAILALLGLDKLGWL